ARDRCARASRGLNRVLFEQAFADAEDGGDRLAFLCIQLFLALAELLAGKHGADRLGRALKDALQPADADGLVDSLRLEIGAFPGVDPKEAAHVAIGT